MKKHRFYRLPVVRGVVALVESLIIGVRAIQMSANLQLAAIGADDDEEEASQELSKKELAGTLIVALILAVALFFLAPLFLTGLFTDYLGEGFTFWFVEGARARRDLHRLPGRRHAHPRPAARVRVPRRRAHEHPRARARRAARSPDTSTKYTTLHVRCGTSFLLVVMVVSIMVFALVGRPAWYWLILSRVVLIPSIAGLSYELIRFAGRYEKNPRRARRHAAGSRAAVDDHQEARRGVRSRSRSPLSSASSSSSRRTAGAQGRRSRCRCA